MLSPGDRALCDREPALPGLRVALDDDALLRTLRDRYPGAVLESVRTTYLRYKPGTSGLVGADTVWNGAPRSVYVRVVHPEDVGKLSPRHAAADPDGPGVSIVQDLGLAIHPFPHDQELSAVRRLADPGERERLLTRLLPAGADAARATVVALRYKPERRFVARVDAPGATPIVIRCYTDDEFAPCMARALAVANAAPGVAQPPCATRDRRRAAAWPWAEGNTLDSKAPPAPDAVRAAARALAALHRAPGAHDGLTHLDLGSAAGAAAEGLAAILPDIAPGARSVARHAIGGTTAAPEARPVHGDFAPDQIVISGQTATLLDFDRAGLADPHLDLGLFAARLRLDARPGWEDSLQAFVHAYEEEGCPVHPRALAAHTALGLLLRAPEPFRRRERNWPDRCTEAIRMAQEELHRAGPVA